MNWPKRGGAHVLFHQIFSLLWKAGRLVVNYLVRITFTRRWIINLLSFLFLLPPLSTVDPNEPGQQDAEQRRFHTQPSSAAQRRSCSPAGSLGNTAVQQRRVSPACGIQQANLNGSNLNKSFRPVLERCWMALTGAGWYLYVHLSDICKVLFSNFTFLSTPNTSAHFLKKKPHFKFGIQRFF